MCRKTLQTSRPEGESNYIGTEWTLGLTYNLAPGVVFDWAFGYLQADSAMAHRFIASQYNAGAGPHALPSDAESIEVAVLSEGVNSVGLTGSFDVEK